MKRSAPILVVVALAAVGCGDEGVEATEQGIGLGCQLTQSALETASISYFGGEGTFPTDVGQLVDSDYVSMPSGVELVRTPAGTGELQGPNWTLRMAGQGDGMPSFTCATD